MAADIYDVQFDLGQALVKAKSAEAAVRYMRNAYGSAHGPYRCKKAAEDDIAWVHGMGGCVHDAA